MSYAKGSTGNRPGGSSYDGVGNRNNGNDGNDDGDYFPAVMVVDGAIIS